MATQTNDSFLKWDPAQVSSFIHPHDSLASEKFLAHNITGSLLPYLTTDHLKEIGISNLTTRLSIKKHISELVSLHYAQNPPKSYHDPEYHLSGININNNLIHFESLTVATVLMKDMIRNLANSSTIPDGSEIKRLNDNFTRLKTDLIPVIRLLKDSKPLPTPTLDPGSGSSIGMVDLPTYSISSTYSPGSTLTEALQDAIKTGPLPSPTSNRFSSGSVLSLGTGKIIGAGIVGGGSGGNSNTNGSTAMNNGDSKPIRPRLVESKSTGSTGYHSSSSSTQQPQTPVVQQGQHIQTLQPPKYRKHSSLVTSSTISTVGNGSTSSVAASAASTASTTATPTSEPLKQLRASSDDSCLKILQQAMKRHHIPRDDWSKYVLVICYGDKERILKLSEKPVPIFKELQELGKHPAIMLRQLAETKEVSNVELYEDSRIADEIPGGTL